MGVYLYNNIYEYSYTFKGKTTAQISSEFSLLTGTIQVNSNGVTGSSSADCRIGKTIPSLANAKKIIITGTYYGSTNSYNACSFNIGYGSGWGTSAAGFALQGSNYTGIYVYCKTNGSSVGGNSVGYINAAIEYKPKFTIDLENKILTGELSGFSNSTLALTDTQVNDIKNNYNQLIPYVSANHSAISEISIRIEE